MAQPSHQPTHQLNVKLSDEEYSRVRVVRERLQPHLAPSDSSYIVTNHDLFMEALTRLERRLNKLDKKAKKAEKGKKTHAKGDRDRTTPLDRA